MERLYTTPGRDIKKHVLNMTGPVYEDHRLGAAEALALIPWPYCCRYFDVQTMNASYLQNFLLHDTIYNDQDYLNEAILTDGVVIRRRIQPEDIVLTVQPADPAVRRPRSALYSVFQERQYFNSFDSKCEIAITARSWLQTLHKLEVLPDFIELLFNNNGGYSSHISYCSDNGCRRNLQASMDSSSVAPERPCAYHVCIKIGSYADREYALYARHDFHTEEDIFFIAGTISESYLSHLEERLNAGTHMSLFHILLDVAAFWLQEVELERWNVDFKTLAVEELTGMSAGSKLTDIPFEKLTLRPDIHRSIDFARFVVFGSSCVKEAIAFLTEELEVYDTICREMSESHHRISLASKSHILSAFKKLLSLANKQAMELSHLAQRLDYQLNIMKTFIAQRDVQSTIDLAKATKKDSEIMRGIAAVTMVFLPATFMATFFSMVFFHVGDERTVNLRVNGWIWLYPVVTVPLTLIISVWYGFSTRNQLKERLRNMMTILRGQKRSAKALRVDKQV